MNEDNVKVAVGKLKLRITWVMLQGSGLKH